MRTRLTWALALALLPTAAAAQSDTARIARATDLSVPSVPAFTLLNVNPATVARPGLVKDFNLDLLVKDGSLLPDIAIEARPVWVFGARNQSRTEYIGSGRLSQILSTLSVSVATVARASGQQLAWALKLSPVRPDPILDTMYIREIGEALDVTPARLRLSRARVDSLLIARTASDTARIEAWFQRELNSLPSQLEPVRKAVKRYQERNWNATSVDIAGGQLLNYENNALDSLALSSKAWGAWASTGSGFGSSRWLLSGMVKWLHAGDESVTFWGANIRFGGAKANGFLELVNETGDEAARTIAYGGEYRFSEQRVIEFGIRTILNGDFELRALRPAVKLRWELGEVRLEDILR